MSLIDLLNSKVAVAAVKATALVVIFMMIPKEKRAEIAQAVACAVKLSASDEVEA